MNTNTSRNDAGISPNGRAKPQAEGALRQQYVSFMLAGQEYAVDIRRVQEIKGWESVTRMPQAPAYFLGVVNLRGAIVPVLDLRARLGLQSVERDAATVIVVINVPRERGERTVGLVVDAVADVHDVAQESIQPPPDLTGAEGGFVRGLANHNGRILVLLDVEKLVQSSLEGSEQPGAALC